MAVSRVAWRSLRQAPFALRAGRRLLSNSGIYACQATPLVQSYSTDHSDPTSYLIVDGYAKSGREELVAGGATVAAELFQTMLEKSTPGNSCFDILFPSDHSGEVDVDLRKYDGIIWTGCSLTVHSAEERVQRQINFSRRCFEFGVPQYGSCWALQVGVVAAGGVCAVNPLGREMGIGRKVTLTPAGRGHPMFEGKDQVFDAFVSHEDEVIKVSPGTTVLAGNRHSAVQAAVIKYLKGEMWAVQYHPEYDLRELAMLTNARKEKLTKKGFFRAPEECDQYVKDLCTLAADPTRKEIAWKYGVDDDVLCDYVRLIECRNWVKHQALPYKALVRQPTYGTIFVEGEGKVTFDEPQPMSNV